MRLSPPKNLGLRQIIFVLFSLLLVVEITGSFLDRAKYSRKHRADSHATTKEIPSLVTYKNHDYIVQKPADTFRILVLGGSAAEGFGNNYEKSWSRLLELKISHLVSIRNKKAELINMATGAATSIDDYVKLIRDGLVLKPDLVIVYNGWNDIAAFCGNPGWITHNTENQLGSLGGGWNYDRSAQLKRRFFLARKYYQIKEDVQQTISEFYAKLRAYRGRLYQTFPSQDLPPFLLNDFSTKSSPVESLSFDQIMGITDIYIPFDIYPKFDKQIQKVYRHHFSLNMESIAKTLKDNHIQALYIFQPDLLFERSKRPLSEIEDKVRTRLLVEKTPLWEKIIPEYYPIGMRLAQHAAKSGGFEFIDMSSIINPPWDDLFIDNVHNTEKGNQVIAELLFKYLQQHHFLNSNAI